MLVNGTFLFYKISIQHVIFANEIDECSNKLDEWGGFAAFVTVNVYDRASRACAYHRVLENIFVTGSRPLLGSNVANWWWLLRTRESSHRALFLATAKFKQV